MFHIPFRKYSFKIVQQNEQTYIFDIIRKKNVVLGPEEWVRQNILHYLIEDLGYPKGKIAIEKEFLVNGRKKRFDLIVFDENMHPFLLVECKAPEIRITQQTINQVVDYNLHFKSKYLVVSNGNESWCFGYKDGSIKGLEAIPVYEKGT